MNAKDVAAVLNDEPANLPSVVVIAGPEPGLVRQILARTLQRLADQAQDDQFEIEQLDANGPGAADAVIDLAVPTLFGTPRTLVVRRVESAPEAVQEALRSTIEQGPNGTLVITHEGGQRGTGIINTAQKHDAHVVKVKKIWPDALPEVIVDHARRAGVRLTDDGAQALIDARGSSLDELFASAEQVMQDSDDDTITGDTVRAMFGGHGQMSAFDIADAAFLGKTSHCLAGLRTLVAADGAASACVVTVAALSTVLRRLAKMPAGRASDYDLARRLGVPPRAVGKLRQQAQCWPHPADLAAVTVALAHADAAVKGGMIDGEALDADQKVAYVERLLQAIAVRAQAR